MYDLSIFRYHDYCVCIPGKIKTFTGGLKQYSSLSNVIILKSRLFFSNYDLNDI